MANALMAKKSLEFGKEIKNMKKQILSTIIIFFIIIVILVVGWVWIFSENKEKEKEITDSLLKPTYQNVREPAVAGQFYPAEAKELTKQVDDFLAQAAVEKSTEAILGLIVPHAGYLYSGQVAAYGFKQLEGESIETVILIGNSHRAYFEGAAIYNEGYFKTPLAEVEVDSDLAQKIIAENKKIKADKSVHALEHSLEVEIPFLQRTLKDFKILPILLGGNNKDDLRILSQAISKNIAEKNVLMLASSDMSHYPPYEQANYADKKVCDAILTGQIEKLEDTIAQLEKENITNTQTFLCGQGAVEVLMMVMENLEAKKIKLLKYANSGDTAEDKSAVVGYSAIGFYGEHRGLLLNREEQKRLLEIARQSVETYIKEGKVLTFSETDPALNQKLGAFVTLRKHGQLRGCIGRFTSNNNPSLYQVVAEMAIAAASQDIRFSPVQVNELSELEYEVSILSPMKVIDDWHQIELGKHGVEIKKDSRSGVFLPQVATETGWDFETFMGELCSQKAGLSWNCWQDKETELYIFTAQVFGEKEE